ncbi:hypothetical protein A6R68_17346, partial [Neotoma lepida]
NVVLDWKRKTDIKYDVFNFWNFPKGLGLNVRIGTISTNSPRGQQFSLSENMISKKTQEGKPACCFDCIPCLENEISSRSDQCVKCPEGHYANTERNQCLHKSVTFLTYDDLLGKTLTAFVLGVFLRHRDIPIVKANNQAFSYILLITLTFCFLCSLHFMAFPSQLPQNAFGLLFTVALSTVLAKTITVVIAFKVTALGSIMRLLRISRTSNIIIPPCTMIQLYGCQLTPHPFVDTDAHSEHRHIIIMCNNGSTAFH